MKYDYKAVEAKWQKVWEDEKTFHVEIDHKSPSSMHWWSSRIPRVLACMWATPQLYCPGCGQPQAPPERL